MDVEPIGPFLEELVIIDAHIHYWGDHPDAVALLASVDAKLLNVAVTTSPGDAWRDQAVIGRGLAGQYPDRYAWCTTFDLPDAAVWAASAERRRYTDAVISGLDRDFAAGAVGCKVWKSIGMELRKPSGEFVMVDDSLFEPIYEHLAMIGRPLLMHIGEPLACWQPLDEHNVHAGYYRGSPEWYMGDKPDHPSHRALIDARDRVLARHPRLRVIGAHLGSLEYDVAELALRLERYANFAVDTSARMPDLLRQDAERVRTFMLRFPDRILYGTDVVQRQPVSSLIEPERSAHLASMRQRYVLDLAYFCSDATTSRYGVDTKGLGLPADVAAAVMGENARDWYPGV